MVVLKLVIFYCTGWWNSKGELADCFGKCRPQLEYSVWGWRFEGTNFFQLFLRIFVEFGIVFLNRSDLQHLFDFGMVYCTVCCVWTEAQCEDILWVGRSHLHSLISFVIRKDHKNEPFSLNNHHYMMIFATKRK